jgi:hypothetical protein
MRAARDVDDNLRQMAKDAIWKFALVFWLFMVTAGFAMVIATLVIGYQNEKKLRHAGVRLDEALEFDFPTFATGPCRTCDGTELIIHDGTPIVVQPFLNEKKTQRQFPTGIQIPCFKSQNNHVFSTRSNTHMSSASGITVDARTVLANPQGMRSIEKQVDCMGAAPCLPSVDYCVTEFGVDYPYGPIYHYTRSNVGSEMVTLEHLCVCVLDWDPVSETTITLPYCTEPLA